MDCFNKAFNSMFVPSFSDKLIADVQTVWQAIAVDVEGYCEDNESAIEMCIDADRLATFASDESNNEVISLCKEFGNTVVIRELSKKLTIF